MNLVKSIYHWFWAWLSSVWYGNPSEDLFVIGVTGTKGKSTTIRLMAEILKESGERVAYFSSAEKVVGSESEEKSLTNTMPGRGRLQKFLRRVKNEGIKYVILEVTSQGVVQHRHKFIDWNVAVFLNLHPEHIEAHGSYKEYREAKLDFFRYLEKSSKKEKHFLINGEDDDGPYFRKAAEKVADSEIHEFSSDDVFKMVQRIRETGDHLWLRADFNVENVAAGSGLADILDIPPEVVESAVRDFEGVKGRMEFVRREPFSVIVDYAHTPDSLRAVYKNVLSNFDFEEDSKLICVFGSAGGGRDKWKRPKLGEVAANFGDVIILTSEDPYDEDPQEIVDDIKKGIEESNERPARVLEILDREEAIERALYLAEPGDFVVITGIGSQDYMYTNEGKIDWDEVGIVEEKLEKLDK